MIITNAAEAVPPADSGAGGDAGLSVDRAVGGRRRVLLVLDEFATLGRIPLLEDVLAYLRGMG